jgi:hypothetical protein
MRMPESKDAKGLYVQFRDFKSRMRTMHLSIAKGDMEALENYVLDDLAFDAEFPVFRECLDFAQGEDFLTPEMIEAAEASIAWGARLRELISAKLSRKDVSYAE